MKKFLSLVLALVMTMSLVTISAGAKDFEDAADINYEAAVEVINAVKVMDGYADGSFGPQNGLTRGAAAKIICNLILGPTTAAELNADTNPYPDVDKDSTFAGYIAYCQKEGIISGYADGTFKAANPLTGYAFMKMLLGALGYDATVEGYTGANWSINVAKQAIGIGLNDGLKTEFNGSAYVTREEAALYAFNTLQATMVEYDTVINIGDVTIAGSQAKNVAQTGYKNTMGAANLQFAEKYFTKLTVEDATDVFGRPANKWINNKSEIGTYVDYTELVGEYTTQVTGKDLYDLLGSTAIKNSTVTVYVDGETEEAVLDTAYFTAGKMIKTNTKGVGETGNGVLTQVFQDVENDEITVVIINTYLAVTDDYSEKHDDLDMTVYMIDDKNNSASVAQYVKTANATETMTVDGEDFDIEDYVDGDIVLVTVADGAIQSIAAPETLDAAEIASYKVTSYLTVDGEKYSFGDTLQYDSELVAYTDANPVINLKDTTYNVYLDAYGYVIGIDDVNDVVNYLFVTGLDDNYSNLSQKTAEVGVIFLDGTMDVVTVNMKDSSFNSGSKNEATINEWCAYTVDKNGVYTLTEVATTISGNDAAQNADTAHTTKISKKNIILDGSSDMTYVYGNDNSIYIVVDTDVISINNTQTAEIIDEVDSIVTGVQNANLLPIAAAQTTQTLVATSGGVYTLFDDDGYVIAAIVVGENDSATSNYVYVTSSNVNLESYDKTADEYTWSRDVVINGVVTTIEYKGDKIDEIDSTSMTKGNWYEVKYYADGTVKSTSAINFMKNNDKFVAKVDNVDALVNTFETIILSDTTTSTKLTCIGATLYTDTAATKGFPVASDVKVILGLTVDGVEFDVVNDYEGVKGLEKAIKDLDAVAAWTAGKVEVNAVIEDGVATSIILNDTTGTVTDTGSNTTSSSAGLSAIGYNNTQGYLAVVTTANVNVDTTYTVTLSMVNGGAVVELGTYDATILAGTNNARIPVGVLASGQQYLVTCGTYSNLITG